MVQSQLVTHFDTAVVPMMDADEARECISRINGHMNSARIELLRLYEGRGWAALGYQSWRECAVNEFGKAKSQLYDELEAAQIESRISGIPENATIPTSQLLPMRALTPMEQPMAWQEANERSGGKPTARIVEEVVSDMRGENDTLDPPMEPARIIDTRPARINVGMFTSATPEWYTPAHIIERVESMFGDIDLDPCSNAKGAAANVPALNHWTIDDNGLVQPWQGKVYMNPPYGDEIVAWVNRIVNAYKNDEIYEGIALLPARTDTAWFQRELFDFPMCFLRGRLKFSGSENSAPFPSVVVYLGVDFDLFNDWFHDIGRITRPLDEAA